MKMRPNVEMRLAGTFLVIAIAFSACAAVSDEPAEVSESPTTIPADSSTDPPSLDIGVADEEVSSADDPAGPLYTEGNPVEEQDGGEASDGETRVHDGTSDDTGDSGVPVTWPTLPDAAFDDFWPSEPMYPGAGIAIPSPRG